MDASSLKSVDDRFVIGIGIAAEKGQRKLTATGCRSMTSARVATMLGQERNHIAIEVNR
jgi:hypothetical protein